MPNSTPLPQKVDRNSSFFQAKVAFKIPGMYQTDGIYGPKYDDALIEDLMDLFEDTEFETENLCSPALLIVNTSEIPTQEWVEDAIRRINEILSTQK